MRRAVIRIGGPAPRTTLKKPRRPRLRKRPELPLSLAELPVLRAALASKALTWSMVELVAPHATPDTESGLGLDHGEVPARFARPRHRPTRSAVRARGAKSQMSGEPHDRSTQEFARVASALLRTGSSAALRLSRTYLTKPDVRRALRPSDATIRPRTRTPSSVTFRRLQATQGGVRALSAQSQMSVEPCGRAMRAGPRSSADISRNPRERDTSSSYLSDQTLDSSSAHRRVAGRAHFHDNINMRHDRVPGVALAKGDHQIPLLQAPCWGPGAKPHRHPRPSPVRERSACTALRRPT
jgi:hypothetical protein